MHIKSLETGSFKTLKTQSVVGQNECIHTNFVISFGVYKNNTVTKLAKHFICR